MSAVTVIDSTHTDNLNNNDDTIPICSFPRRDLMNEWVDLYGEWYAVNVKQRNYWGDRRESGGGSSGGDPNYFLCENWIGPALKYRRMPMRCFSEREYRERMRELQQAGGGSGSGAFVDPALFKPCCTHFTKLEEYRIRTPFPSAPRHTITLLKCKLDTGRTHQIRLQAQAMGMGVVGDRVYHRRVGGDGGGGGDTRKRSRRSESIDLQIEKHLFGDAVDVDWFVHDYHAVHAHKLQFRHPVHKRVMAFQVEVPEVMKAVVRRLREEKEKENENENEKEQDSL